MGSLAGLSQRSPDARCERPRLPHRSKEPESENPEGSYVWPQMRSQCFQRSSGAKASTPRTWDTDLVQLAKRGVSPPAGSQSVSYEPEASATGLEAARGRRGVCWQDAGQGSVRTALPGKRKSIACQLQQIAILLPPRFPHLQREGVGPKLPLSSFLALKLCKSSTALHSAPVHFCRVSELSSSSGLSSFLGMGKFPPLPPTKPAPACGCLLWGGGGDVSSFLNSPSLSHLASSFSPTPSR